MPFPVKVLSVMPFPLHSGYWPMYWLNGEMAVSLLVEAGEIEREVLGSLEWRQPERHRIINAPMYAEVHF